MRGKWFSEKKRGDFVKEVFCYPFKNRRDVVKSFFMNDNEDIEQENVVSGLPRADEASPSPAEPSPEKGRAASSSGRRKPLPVRILIGIAVFLVAVVLMVVVALSFCAFDKRKTISIFPKNFSVFVGTDSAYGTVEPMLDLQAADVFLATPELRSVRPAFMMLRSSSLRRNPVVKAVASRPVKLALYENGDGAKNFLAAIDLGFLSAFSRALPAVFPFAYPRLSQALSENGVSLSFEKDGVLQHFKFSSGDMTVFFAPVKNFVVASDSLDVLSLSVLAENGISYSDEQRRMMESPSGSLRIVANAQKLAGSFTNEGDILGSMVSLLPYDSLSEVSLRVSDSDIVVDVSIPVSPSADNPTSLDSLVTKKSSVPAVVSKMTDIVQYYTVVNAGTLSELQSALFPILPVKDAGSLWSKANAACKLAFSMDIDEMLFSWTGKELAAFGIENQNDPVFALQVVDEKKRQQVFDKLVSSVFVKDDNSLILGGVRLPKIKLPAFLGGLLSLFGVSIPEPYFMVLDGFIYFSESPECLSAIFSNSASGNPLMKSEGWGTVSDGIRNEATVSLFYDLERSVPFFLRSNESLSQVLELYTMGRFDAKIVDGGIKLVLHANARKPGDLRSVPGFPVSVDKSASVASFIADDAKNPSAVFWTERGGVGMLDLSSLEQRRAEKVGKCEVAVADGVKGGAVWAVNADGFVYLCDKSMNLLPNFPVVISDKVVPGIVPADGSLVVPLESGSLVVVSPDGSTARIDMPEISIKSSPAVLGNTLCVYDKSFVGGVYFVDLKKLECLNAESPLFVDGIAFGSPALVSSGKKTYAAFVTQSGIFSVWDSAGDVVMQKQLDGVFNCQAVAGDSCFYVLSSDAVLYRIDLRGNVLSVRIPRSTAKNAFVSVRDSGGKGKLNVFVNADSNVMYGFSGELELLSGFPISGSGRPVFADVNGDKTLEMLAMTMDRKIVAWKMR